MCTERRENQGEITVGPQEVNFGAADRKSDEYMCLNVHVRLSARVIWLIPNSDFQMY